MTPWTEMVRAAALLGLAPEAFWKLSLREWRMLTERPGAPTPMNRGDLDRMTEAWPDRPPPTGRCAAAGPPRGREEGFDDRDI